MSHPMGSPMQIGSRCFKQRAVHLPPTLFHPLLLAGPPVLSLSSPCLCPLRGSNFIFDPKGKLDRLSLRLTARLTKQVLVLKDCLPANFKEGVTYYCDAQFKP